MEQLTEILQRFTGDPGLPKPQKVIRAKWSTDEFSLGSIPFPMLKADKSDFDVLCAPLPNSAEPRVLFAGDYTEAQHWGTLNGARLSGLREAKRVLNRIKEIRGLEEELRGITPNSN